MENYIEQLKKQERTINDMISKAEKDLRAIRIKDVRKVSYSKRRNTYQYYLVDPDGKRIYVKKKDMGIVQKILQREYDIEIIKKLFAMKKSLDRFLESYDINSVVEIYDSLGDARKEMVKPIIPSDEEYICKWMEENKGGKNPFPEQGAFITNKGEYVRSKSEKILADLFQKHNIPYNYEPLFVTDDNINIYPDFVLLNVRTRKTIYWEHFGLTMDGEYAKKTLIKLNKYEMSGLEIGKDILFSMESEMEPLNVRLVEKKIERYCL